MPQSERLSAHALIEEIESNPVLRKTFMDIIIKEMSQESELKGCLLGVINDQISCINAKKR
jgi:hypothetical protein